MTSFGHAVFLKNIALAKNRKITKTCYKNKLWRISPKVSLSITSKVFEIATKTF